MFICTFFFGYVTHNTCPCLLPLRLRQGQLPSPTALHFWIVQLYNLQWCYNQSVTGRQRPRSDCQLRPLMAPPHQHHAWLEMQPKCRHGPLVRLFQDRSRVTMFKVYKSMVRCRLGYFCPLWNPAECSVLTKPLSCYDRLNGLQLQYLVYNAGECEGYIIIYKYMWKIRHRTVCKNCSEYLRNWATPKQSNNFSLTASFSA